MKIAFIGNSHLACIKDAWQVAEGGPAHFICGSGTRFFRTLRRTKEGLKLSRSRKNARNLELWRLTHGTDAPFDCASVDVIFVVGLVGQPRPWSLITPLDAHEEELQRRLGRPPVSLAVWKECVAHTCRLTEATRLQQLIAPTSKQRVLHIPKPLVREDAGEFDERYRPPVEWERLGPSEKDLLYDRERRLYLEFTRELGLEVWLPDSRDVINGFTAPKRYSLDALGSPDLTTGLSKHYGDEPHENRLNLTHKNIEYGLTWVRRILAEFQAT